MHTQTKQILCAIKMSTIWIFYDKAKIFDNNEMER